MADNRDAARKGKAIEHLLAAYPFAVIDVPGT